MRTATRWLAAAGVAVCALGAGGNAQAGANNVILFVPDGLRAQGVNATTAPVMNDVKTAGVWFRNSHSIFPTFTMPNSSAMATGHKLGDTGVFSNTLYLGVPLAHANNQTISFIENDAILGDVDDNFGGDFLNEETILAAARKKGFSTGAVGKVGPTLLFDHTERSGLATVVVDDATGSATGIPLSAEIQSRLTAAGLPLVAPSRGANGASGNATTPGTLVPNTVQQQYFADVVTKVLLPLFKERKQRFMLVFWSRDPDGTQHNQGDSLNTLIPGINGPTSLAAVANADANLAQIRGALKDLGLDRKTDIIVSADHGFSTISKASSTSTAALGSYTDVPAGFLPPGFVAIDIAKGLGLPLFDPDAANAAVDSNKHPSRGDAFIGTDPSHPQVIVAANGGSDLVYIPGSDAVLAKQVAAILARQDYTSGLFADSKLGPIPGALSTRAISLEGTALTPMPAIVVNFKSFDTQCGESKALCTAEVADSGLQQGQGMHGSFSRADTWNFQAAIGPDFKHGFVDRAPSSNADVGRTIAALLQLDIPGNGDLRGRVLREAFPGKPVPPFTSDVASSSPADNGFKTKLRFQTAAGRRYFDAAGFDGRTVGLTGDPSQ